MATRKQMKLYSNMGMRPKSIPELYEVIETIEESQGIKPKKRVNMAMMEEKEDYVNAAVQFYADRNKKPRPKGVKKSQPKGKWKKGAGENVKSTSSTSSVAPTCWICHAIGHFRKDCPSKRETKRQ